MSDFIMKIQPSFSRRLFGVIILSVSALIMMNFVFTDAAQSAILKAILFGFSLVFLWQVQANLRFTKATLILTRDGLFDTDGGLVCSLSNIEKVDRGWLSFKPSNGFLLRLHEPMPSKWSPGLYWRIGRSLGVGGAISPAETKKMSDKIILLLQEKDLGVDLV
jgi:hypothetical protein